MHTNCFFSVYTLKSFISLGTIATLIIGICLLFVLVYAFIISSVTAQIQSDFRTLFIAMFFFSSIMMIASSIAAIYGNSFIFISTGILRKKNKFLVFYAVTIGLYFASFLVLGIFSTGFPNQLKNQCEENPDASLFQLAYNEANRTLCRESCPCYFPNFEKYTVQQKQTIHNMGVTNIIDNQTFPVNSQTCETWSNQTYTNTPHLLMIETFFNCAGWCNVNPEFNLYYFFSNINNGIPEKSCVDAFIQFFDKFGKILEISSFIVSGILFLILTNILCLCFHPERTHQYDALKFFRESFVQKKKKGGKQGIQIFQIKEIYDFED